MAMLEKHRNVLYNHFAPQLGEEVTQALMSNFPSRDVEETVTKADLNSELGALHLELADFKAEVRTEIGAVRLELESFKTEVHRMMNRQTVFLTTVISVAVGILLRAG